MPGQESATDEVNVRGLIQEDRIHGSLYTNPAIFRQEMQKIFREGWVFVCHESEIPARGNFVRRTIAGDPVIAVRAGSGAVNVFVNRCVHRGNMMCHEAHGTARALVCKYHGWAYDLEGRLVDVPYPGGSPGATEKMRLLSLPRVESYRGFVFASFNKDVVPLTEHLGRATALIDRTVEASPVGRIRLNGGWVSHRMKVNWKMLPENDVDGYHVNFVHPSFAQAIRSHYDTGALSSREEDLVSEARDWGNGHTELFFGPSYKQPLEWLGCRPDRFPAYIEAMKQAYGEAEGMRKMILGPPHACIFPNLFLAEGNIVMFEPVSANECIHWHTPLQLEGVEDALNDRLMRQSDGALGPAAFLLADDAVIAERTQIALGSSGGWLDLGRGLNREHEVEGGIRVGHLTDETTNRGFWHHYCEVMTGSRPTPAMQARAA